MEGLNPSRCLTPARMPPLRGPLVASKAAGRFCIEPGSTLHLAGGNRRLDLAGLSRAGVPTC